MELHVLNPVALRREENSSVAQRVTTLAGLQIGLYWNHKPGGDIALKRTAELLTERFSGVRTRHYLGSVGGAYHQVTKDDVRRIAGECAAVIGTTAD